MARGFLSGVIWGVVFSGAGVAALSLSAPLPDRVAPLSDPVGQVDSAPLADAPETAEPETAEPEVPEPDTPEPEAPEPEATAAPAPQDATAPLVARAPAPDTVPEPAPDLSQPGRRPEPETGVDRPAAPAGSLAAPSDPVVSGADTVPPAPPVVGAAPDAPEGAAPALAGAPVRVTGEAPLQPPLPSPAPGAPRPEARPVIVTGPAQPPEPVVPAADSALAPEAAPEPAPEPAPVPEVADAPAVADATLEAAGPEPEADPPAAAPEADTPPVAALPQVDPPETADVVAPSRPAVGTPARSLVTRPATAPAEADPLPGDDSPLPAALAALPPDSPLVRFAADVEVPADVPRMAIVLIDEGTGPLGPEGLESFPFPVSFAIPPSHPKAAEAAAGYRRLGFEVLALAALPEGATAGDVEVTLAGVVGAVPEAVAVLEDPAGGLQENREVSDQVATYLGASGHGLVMQPKGLNTAQKLALKDGVPAVTLFRDFDGEGQDTGAIRRTLDQASFRARQEGGVVMLGRLRADTISALVLWGLQDRSGTITLVPVSTVLSETLAAR
ncbi:polysaccharide deacteylase family 2 protein [Maliponia aquimaris]|uniref:Divergent polysaccharide deacetylase n=1 Tax=Maliponia aquimaris TaxID=1673631 RepID=A0A238L048_9RHOB|nr:polysaccharide deacteylase family 2 protein [Maliponia aquimaris]SMX48409.1 Divergent polysaccharide deacetylase [Maliponia aquimaris]